MGRLNPVREERGAKPTELTHSSVPQSMLLPPRPPRPVAVASHPPRGDCLRRRARPRPLTARPRPFKLCHAPPPARNPKMTP